MVASITVKPKKRGRPATGRDPLIAARLPPELTARIDARAKREQTSRSEAIRRLIEHALASTPTPVVKFRRAKRRSLRNVEQDLDDAIANTFPASDPVAAEEPAPLEKRRAVKRIRRNRSRQG